MPNFDLAVISAIIIAFGLIMYVITDGFDLGVGIIFKFAPSTKSRDELMSSIAPFWDGNETWIIFCGGLLYAAFPLAFSIILPALYFPVLMMIISLILRGISFEFRGKAESSKWIWNWVFTIGSVSATFMQGLIISAFLEGFKVENHAFTGSIWDWLTPFSITCGFAMIAAYSLLGSTWIILKTEGATRKWAQNITKPILLVVVVFLIMISLKSPLTHTHVMERWFSYPNIIYLSPIPFFTILCFYLLVKGINRNNDLMPFLSAIGIFLLSFIGLGVSIWPHAIMPSITIWEAAASEKSQKFLFYVLPICLIIILAYTSLTYRVLRGKIDPNNPIYKS